MSLKQLIALSVSAAALAYTAFPAVQAAVKPAPLAKSNIIQVQQKTKAKSTCGTYMYWSTKEKKCVDARLKKSTKPWYPF